MEKKVKEITTSAASGNADMKAMCKLVEGMVKCVTDASCCDEEEDGKKMKDSVKVLVDTYNAAPYNCKVKGCE
jgi:hypothetical protein